MNRKAYPSDVNDDEWAFMGPYLKLMREDTLQRLHELPPWYKVYKQMQRWIAAGVFEAMIHDVRVLLHLAAGREEQPTSAIFDGRILGTRWVPRRRAGPVPATMGASVKKAAKCIWR